MIDLRPVVLVVGILTTIMGIFMLVPLMQDLMLGDPNWRSFALSALLCGTVGGGMAAATFGQVKTISTRQGFLITTTSWIALCIAGSLPLYMSTIEMSYTDAFFETMSGLTTTGATVVTGLDDAPRGFLLWRSILQWIGGVGVIIMAIAMLPFLSVGGMQLFRSEGFQSEKELPRAGEIATTIVVVYTVLTALCAVLFLLAGMTLFDAINHAMTSIATGGMSTHDASFGYYFNPDNDQFGPTDLIADAFMVIGSLPFAVFLYLRRGNWRAPLNDEQIRFFLGLTTLLIVIISVNVLRTQDFSTGDAIRHSAFNVISILTGTGYTSDNYTLWGPFAVGFFFCIMFIGGCAGSTSCGMKIFRLQILLSALLLYGKRLAHPHRKTVHRFNGTRITEDVYLSVFVFVFVYFASFATIAVLLTLFRLDPVTALSGAGTALANVGPGLGEIIGPAGNFVPLPDGAKWVLCGAMLIGRLEFLTVLVLFVPSFWQK